MKKRRRPPRPESNAKRLNAALEQNLKHARDPALRERLQRAIAALKQRVAA
jgi:DNA-binding MurR/RpiR family transcriptional regulator